MKYRESNRIDPALVMQYILRSPETWGLLLAAMLVPLLAGQYLTRYHTEREQQETAGSLCETAQRQAEFTADTLDTVALIMNESTSNVHYIDVGRTENADDSIEAALACQELKSNTEPYPNINSAYLVCNLNHTIYNSLDSIGYASDEFYDLSWRQQYYASQGGMQVLDTVRVVHTPYRQEVRYISMISRVPYFSTLQNKWLVYNIDVDDLCSRLVTEGESGGENARRNRLWVFNGKGELLWDQSGKSAPENYSALTLPEEFRQGEQSWTLLTVDETEYLIVQAQDDKYGWYFVQAIPYADICKEISSFNRMVWAAMTIILVAAVLLLIFSMYNKNARELQAAMEVKRFTGIQPHEEELCLDYLQRVSRQEQEHARQNEVVLNNFSDVLEQHVVMSLISGEPIPKGEAEARQNMMRQMGLLTDAPQKYVVFLARIEAISALKLNLHQDIYTQFRRILQYGCNEHMIEDYKAFYTWADHSMLAAIVVAPAGIGNKQIQMGLNQMGRAMQQQLTLLSEQPVIIAFGSVAEDPWKLPESYEHAKQLIQHKVYYHKDVPYTYSEKMEADMQMSYDHQKKLVDQIKLGKVKDASELLESYFTMLHNNPYLELDRAREIGIQLADVIHSAIAGHDRNIEEPFSDVKKIQKEISAMESVHNVADLLLRYTQAAASAMLEQLQNKKDIRVQEILEWINNNYNQDISLDDVAEQMGLSPTYASKQIKAYTGTNVVSYINNLRIEHAKELLATTKMSSNEIGAYVGFRYSQSFIRSFRKIVGMTPGSYRSLHQGAGTQEEPSKTDTIE